jgi:uncharacterized protein (TIGR00299 family) protein
MVALRAMSDYHLDCSSGIAGDMFLGACLDLGLPIEVIAEAVASLGLRGVTVEQRRASRGGFAGTRFRVLLAGRPIEGPDPEEGAETAGDHGHEPAHGGHEHSHGNSAPSPGDNRDEAGEGKGHAHQHAHGADLGHQHPHAADHGHQHPHGADHLRDSHGQRDLAQIQTLLATSGLAPAVRERALRLFARLGEAEARAHGMAIEQVHFHEVGAVDSIVDLVGAAAAIEHLAPRRLTCGPVNVGGGRVRTAHGELPVPAPATAELLRGVPIYGGPGGELTTPTGAVLLAELVDSFGDLPPFLLEATGHGLGRKNLAMQPNLLRLLRGEPAGTAAMQAGWQGAQGAPAADAPQVAVIECEVDNLPGEGFGFLMERLFGAGALDVYFTALVMKKSRPGTLVTLLCRQEQLRELAAILLLESGSLGCRYHMAARFEAARDFIEVETVFGTVRLKRGSLDGRTLAMAPEYEDCRRLALAAGVPWRTVHQAALAALGDLQHS